MGNNLFAADIAGRLAKAMGKHVLPVVLIKVSAPVRDPVNLTAAQTVRETKYPCRGFIDTYDSRRMRSTAIEEGSRVVLILGGTLPDGIEPRPEDKIKVGSTTYRAVGPVVSDPDLATYVVKVKL